MKQFHYAIIAVFSASLLAASIYVPWKVELTTGRVIVDRDMGYSFIFDKPAPAAKIDYPKIFVKYVILGASAALLYILGVSFIRVSRRDLGELSSLNSEKSHLNVKATGDAGHKVFESPRIKNAKARKAATVIAKVALMTCVFAVWSLALGLPRTYGIQLGAIPSILISAPFIFAWWKLHNSEQGSIATLAIVLILSALVLWSMLLVWGCLTSGSTPTPNSGAFSSRHCLPPVIRVVRQ